jgi:hypothetical protein
MPATGYVVPEPSYAPTIPHEWHRRNQEVNNLLILTRPRYTARGKDTLESSRPN